MGYNAPPIKPSGALLDYHRRVRELDAELQKRHNGKLLRVVFPFLAWTEADTFLTPDGKGWMRRPVALPCSPRPPVSRRPV